MKTKVYKRSDFKLAMILLAPSFVLLAKTCVIPDDFKYPD